MQLLRIWLILYLSTTFLNLVNSWMLKLLADKWKTSQDILTFKTGDGYLEPLTFSLRKFNIFLGSEKLVKSEL